MLKLALAYTGTFLVFLAIDFVWLGFVAQKLYKDQIGHLLADKPALPAAAVFYLLYVAGIMIFAVTPALKEDSSRTALVSGALFGFFAYATYDMTNLATLRGWPLTISLVDMGWGTILTALTALGGYWIAKSIG